MSCHGCAAKFGLFTKEIGCPGCGFSFCKKCLRFKTIIPKLETSELTVCRSCYERYSNEKQDNEKECRPPPEVFLRSDPAFYNLPNIPSTIPASFNDISKGGNGIKMQKTEVDTLVRRLESLENPARPPITVYHHDPRMEQLKTGLTAEDREIAERLEKLKEERKRQREVPTEEDIVRRLAALKDQDADRAVEVTLKKKEVFHLPDTRSDEQKTNDLIKQLLQEQILAAKDISPEELIAKRLARLRGEDSSTAVCPQEQVSEVDVEALAAESQGTTEMASDEDVQKLVKLAKAELDAAQREMRPGMKKSKTEEDFDTESAGSVDSSAVDQVVKRAMDEAALGDDDEDELESKSSSDVQDTEELPWCTICNEDATKRCFTCDGDLFCSKCFTEFHKDSEMKGHQTTAFIPKKKD